MTSNTPSNPPSSRPMTLRQQLYTQFEQHGLPMGFLSNPKQWQYFNDSLDEAMKLIEAHCQEIAREAVLEKVTSLLEMSEDLYFPYGHSDEVLKAEIAELTHKPEEMTDE